MTVTTATSAAVGDVCRLTVYGPASRVELAVPVHVPLADLLPTLLGHLDQRLATTGLEHGGWVLQRLGEPPLEEDLGTAALGLYDGDVVHLRPRDEQLPPIDFDDLVDGVATGVADRKDRWRPEHGRRLAHAGALLAGLLGLIIALRLPDGTSAARAAGVAGAVLLASAVAAARAFADRSAAQLLALVAVAYAAAAGLALPLLHHPPSVQRLSGAPSLVSAGVFVAVAALLARYGTAAFPTGLPAVAGAGALTALGALLRCETGLHAAGAAAVLVPLVLLLGYFAPTFAAAAAGLAVPKLPTTPEQFQSDLEPEKSATVLQRTAVADRYLLGCYAALAAVLSGALCLVAAKGGIAASLLVLSVTVLLLLHCRELISAWHRVTMLLPATVGTASLILGAMAAQGAGSRVVDVAAATLLAVLACMAGRVLPARRLIPHWGLAGDIAHWLVAAAVVPLALQVCDLYSTLHRMWS